MGFSKLFPSFLKLRSSDISLASDDSLFDVNIFKDPKTGRARKDQDVIDYCEDQAEKMGLRIVKKSTYWTKLSKFTTTYYKEIRLGVGYDKLNTKHRAALWAHEIQHAKQWRHFGRRTFRTKYIFDGRFRWAMEMQSYRTSVRAYKFFGFGVKEIIRDKWKELRDDYVIVSVRSSHLKKYTTKLLQEAFDTYKPPSKVPKPPLVPRRIR